jgi:hypothetical protein
MEAATQFLLSPTMDPASSSSGHQHIRTTPVLSSREEAINAWAATLTLDCVQLNEESSDIVAINGLLRHLLTQKHLRRFCVMFTICLVASTYKRYQAEVRCRTFQMQFSELVQATNL